jgi:hypothetical protein
MRDAGPPWNETPVDHRGFVSFQDELAAFNAIRRQLLGGRPINRDGEPVLMPPEEQE